jgi:hypothetical protein
VYREEWWLQSYAMSEMQVSFLLDVFQRHYFVLMVYKPDNCYLLDWKTHGNEYYECSRYKENPAVAQEANHIKGKF